MIPLKQIQTTQSPFLPPPPQMYPPPVYLPPPPVYLQPSMYPPPPMYTPPMYPPYTPPSYDAVGSIPYEGRKGISISNVVSSSIQTAKIILGLIVLALVLAVGYYIYNFWKSIVIWWCKNMPFGCPKVGAGERCTTHMNCDGWKPATAGTLGCCTEKTHRTANLVATPGDEGVCEMLVSGLAGVGYCSGEGPGTTLSGQKCTNHIDCKGWSPAYAGTNACCNANYGEAGGLYGEGVCRPMVGYGWFNTGYCPWDESSSKQSVYKK